MLKKRKKPVVLELQLGTPFGKYTCLIYRDRKEYLKFAEVALKLNDKESTKTYGITSRMFGNVVIASYMHPTLQFVLLHEVTHVAQQFKLDKRQEPEDVEVLPEFISRSLVQIDTCIKEAEKYFSGKAKK